MGSPNFDFDSENDGPNDAMLSESESGGDDDDMGSEISLMRDEVIQELLSLTTSLGGDHHKNQKLFRKAVGATVSEM